jgi:hypothetical protein
MMHSPKELAKVQKYHVVSGHVTTGQLASGKPLTTLEGSTLAAAADQKCRSVLVDLPAWDQAGSGVDRLAGRQLSSGPLVLVLAGGPGLRAARRHRAWSGR